MPYAGQRIKALDFTAAVQASDTTQFLNASTTPSAGSPEVTVTFIAPTSGKVLVTIGASVGESAGSEDGNGVFDYRVYENNGSGTIVFNLGSLIRRLICIGAGTQAQEITRTSLLTGLTPGGTYFARFYHASYGSPAIDVYARQLTVAPCPA